MLHVRFNVFLCLHLLVTNDIVIFPGHIRPHIHLFRDRNDYFQVLELLIQVLSFFFRFYWYLSNLFCRLLV